MNAPTAIPDVKAFSLKLLGFQSMELVHRARNKPLRYQSDLQIHNPVGVFNGEPWGQKWNIIHNER